jgi:hypothetical protein
MHNHCIHHVKQPLCICDVVINFVFDNVGANYNDVINIYNGCKWRWRWRWQNHDDDCSKHDDHNGERNRHVNVVAVDYDDCQSSSNNYLSRNGGG